MKNVKNLFLVIMVVFVSACTPEKKTLAETSIPTPSEDDPLQTVDSPLYVQLGTRWEMDTTGAYELNASCEIPKLAPLGTTKNCTFTVPEAKLFYSNLKFLIGTTMASSCPLIHFSPYYYRRSNVATFRPEGETADIDCLPATKPDNPKCFGGAAPAMLDDFPENRGRYFNTTLTGQQNFDLPSENSTRWYGGLRVNYHATNNITDPTSSLNDNSAMARTGLPLEWIDYSVVCTDIWNEMQFQINFIIEDENWDPGGAGLDNFPDWP
jgi:hypothetical protein